MDIERKAETCVELFSGVKTNHGLVLEQMQIAHTEDDDRHFLICNLGDIISKYRRWEELLPRVKPYYAVKCYDEIPVLEVLRDCGASFDCASKSELKKILDLGISFDRIIYAHPCKQPSTLRFARQNKVSLMTFDNESELEKVSRIYQEAKLVLRILIESQYKGKLDFGSKYGCCSTEIKDILQKAKDLQLHVIGVSFHVGSMCNDSRAWSTAIKQAKNAFDIARELGIHMNLLDIGGGFPGHIGSDNIFEKICIETNANLDKYFPREDMIDIIAEPGRYMVASAGIIGVNIISKRKVAICRADEAEKDRKVCEFKMMYYVNDGVYGGFLCKIVEEETYNPKYVRLTQGDVTDACYDTVIWGPSCDSVDILVESIKLPLLEVGDWLYFENMGAYSLPLSTSFNGMDKPRQLYYCNENLWKSLCRDCKH